ncbi:hypothetical protein AMJ51_02600 [Microgenomates bacterium DG_75]|nr:MAG: hypothetical protein AMJ51_02600 [Microgenomates bacterium DG_75]
MKDKIRNDLKEAIKESDQAVISVLRLLLAEIHNQEIAKQAELTVDEIGGVVQKEVKERKESIEAYQKGGREDLVEKEKKELVILNKYLPQQLSPKELETAIQLAIKEVGASEMADFGKVMAAVMAKVRGKADGKVVGEAVKKALSP